MTAVSNSGQPFETLVVVGNSTFDLQTAVSFTTGPASTELSSVTIHGFGFGNVTGFKLALYTGIGSGGPLGLVATLVGESSPGIQAAYTYRPAAPLVLNQNATYWLVASAPNTVSPSGFSWRSTASLDEDAGALSGWSIVNARWVTNNGGASWFTQTNLIPQFSVDVSVGPASAPIITVQPAAVNASAGSNITLSLTATGNPAPSFQWRKDGVDLPGATASTLTLNFGSASNAGRYTVLVTNSAGSVTSQPVIVERPNFTAQPVTQSVIRGTTTTFSAGAASNFPISYQWLKDGVAIPGATAATLSVSNVQLFNLGDYSLVATNIAGSTNSNVAALSFLLSNAGRLANLSIRTNAGTGAQALIVGVVIGGANTTGTKPLLMRGVGPALGGFGVPGFLADPTLSLFTGTTVVASNDNWAGDAQVTAISTQVGAFALGVGTSRDAALYNPALNAEAYTIQITGVGGTTGVVLAEIYDATPANVFFPTTPRLVNVSARTQVGTDANILITGFNISGTTPQSLLIRAVGPTLGGFGVTGFLADPRLDLYAGNTLVQANDNWGGVAAITAAAASVGAFALDAASRDAVLLVTLPPGSYTAQVSGVGNTTGVALVEIYEVP